jgi:2-iminoacetate synthase
MPKAFDGPSARQKTERIRASFDFGKVARREVEAALSREYRDLRDLGALLSPAAVPFLEDMAALAKDLTLAHFGRNISLYSPLYISNYCQNRCLYCGFSVKNPIRRARLGLGEIKAEAQAMARTGLRDILVLTGDSKSRSGPEYIAEAVREIARLFPLVGLEVYPLDISDYARLHEAGADYLSVYQETYDPALYLKVHPAGPKRDFAYRFQAQARALEAGFRGVSFGALLGLHPDFRAEALACGAQAHFVSQSYPMAEIGYSVPRLRPYPNQEASFSGLTEAHLLQVILAFRIFMPWASISLSTRESAAFRDNVIGLGVTRMSAGVCTGVGGHLTEEAGDEQFRKADPRSLAEMRLSIESRNFEAVLSDYVRL